VCVGPFQRRIAHINKVLGSRQIHNSLMLDYLVVSVLEASGHGRSLDPIVSVRLLPPGFVATFYRQQQCSVIPHLGQGQQRANGVKVVMCEQDYLCWSGILGPSFGLGHLSEDMKLVILL
jgi:hypothetical protein